MCAVVMYVVICIIANCISIVFMYLLYIFHSSTEERSLRSTGVQIKNQSINQSFHLGATAQGLQVINSADPCVLKSNYHFIC